MFVETLNQVTEQTRRKCQDSKDYLSHAIDIWCNQLNIPQNIRKYILDNYSQLEIIQDFTEPIDKEGTTEMNNTIGKSQLIEALKIFTDKNPFYQHIKNEFLKMKIVISSNNNITFIVLIAFAITAIGYWIYTLNNPKQQPTTRREKPRQSNPNPPGSSISTVQTLSNPTSPVKIITKQLLVLVVSHLQADFLKSLKKKGRINVNEGETLYEITKCLWLGDESEFSQIKANLDQYLVSEGKESEYDIYLVYIELNQADERFKPKVNQIDRHDAFRKLVDLEVNVTISPRLKMEAYENIGVYNR